MKAKISKGGFLLLKRNHRTEFRSQFCPYSMNEYDVQVQCGEWCPHFMVLSSQHDIKLCHNDILYCESIEIEQDTNENGDKKCD